MISRIQHSDNWGNNTHGIPAFTPKNLGKGFNFLNHGGLRVLTIFKSPFFDPLDRLSKHVQNLS